MAPKTVQQDTVTSGKKGSILQRYRGALANAVLLAILLLYVLVGGFIFLYIEGSEQRQTTAIAATVEAIASTHTESLIRELLRSNRSSLARVAVQENFTAIVKDKMKDLILSAELNNILTELRQTRWTLPSSLFFCMTVITTIGYGTIAPVTTAGRMLCIVYATFGIPLLLLILSILGNRLASPCRGICLKLLLVKVKERVQEVMPRVELRKPGVKEDRITRSSPDNPIYFTRFGELHQNKFTQTEIDEKTAESTDSLEKRRPAGEGATCISVTLLLVVYLLIGAGMYSSLNDWPFTDGLYFVFVSLSTIGFGDVMPNGKQTFLLFCSIYTLIGLAIMSTCFSLAQKYIRKTFRLVNDKCSG
ncbi:TWiK family of potassium channels protein 18-like [Ptychodera flava]|uniref:TWiK family of potassium channels protein 18-like n=1 Tax=Ptychodera flava TaxID=63121 RepID=UPI00396A62CF